MPDITLVEVGPRDGLQNEKGVVATDIKLALIRRLADAGFSRIEATAFVSPKWVPQMADHAAVMAGVPRRAGLIYSVLAPNEKGAAAAIAAGADEIAVFTAASESFARKNTNCSIAESLERFLPVMALARQAGIPVRGYVSCVLDCPYEGAIPAQAVAEVAARLDELGCVEISLGDTIGRGTPEATAAMVEAVAARVPVGRLAGHFHDTAGRALANVAAAHALGVTVFDGSVGGLGGCPYAPGAAGNVATEALVGFFEGQGLSTGIDLARLAETGRWVRAELGRAGG
ncbi:hydroxymethylglutaryl-CoA lyase [Phreatobacter stygius]|uniref:hydroxymethylglutaryl-CoA lyase n=1 Tax=Phreatobacter stygius TaxID=1940610 RepID=A0A4D7B613_9HYPH|nr:hydroxymethylglutaryl-CoA lyase [Phreatobacter stygius]QCI68774.1 hydroxymethylglutaryl-CoA lyase [Phreatobacter stygius]